MAVLVTGAGGFLGSWVVRELLQRGEEPIAMDVLRPEERWERLLGAAAAGIAFVPGNLLKRDLLARVVREYHVTSIIHLAALLTPDCQRDPWTGCEVNVLGSIGILELLRTHGDQIGGLVYASSYAVYGDHSDQGFAGLSTADGPSSLYGAYKLAVDIIAEQYWRHFRVPSVGIRPHVIYGPERTEGLTAGPSLAARAAAQGVPYEIGYTGKVSYDYVEDVARAFVDTAQQMPGGNHTVDLPGYVASTHDFVQCIGQLVPTARGKITVQGPPIPPNVAPQPNYITSILPDWRPTDLLEGIRRTIDFYRELSR